MDTLRNIVIVLLAIAMTIGIAIGKPNGRSK
jgi:hypothetical protein